MRKALASLLVGLAIVGTGAAQSTTPRPHDPVREKRLEWVTGAAHVITVDYGRERVIELLASWMEGKLVSR